MRTGPVRIGNCSGFYGDRLAAMREMLEGGPLNVLTGDYLAELTMLILARSRLKDPTRGYATTFLRQLEDCLGLALESQVKLVVNAGGLNPAGCADAVRELAARLGLTAAVAHVEGDDLMGRLDSVALATVVPPVSANAYLGGWPLTAALAGGADIVVAGRCTDAALVTGPAAWWHGWARTDYDRLAGAMVAGHVLECGAQATGGNYSFFTTVPGMTRVGFPAAEVAANGNSVIYKHPGTGGQVSVGTVTAQLLYEIGAPLYPGPDATADFGSISLSADGPDRVAITGVRGYGPPPELKVAINHLGGWRNSVTVLLCGLDIEAKAALLQEQLAPSLLGTAATTALVRLDRPDPASEEEGTAAYRVTVQAATPEPVGRAFSAAAVELALASVPGFHLTAPPGDASPYGVFTPGYVDSALVPATVVHADGRREQVAAAAPGSPRPPVPGRPAAADAATSSQPNAAVRTVECAARVVVPLGRLVGARSGDKGGDANLGVWTPEPSHFRWLASFLTVERLGQLLPEVAALPIRRYELPNLRALNFVLPGLLGEGVASSTRFDPQGKALGEWLRARLVDVPAALLR